MTEDSLPLGILVGVDGSASSLDALREGASLAAALHLPLEAHTAWEYPGFVDYYPIPNWSPHDDATAALTAAVHEVFGDDLPDNFVAHVTHGQAARILIERSKNAAMLVLGSRGLGGFGGLLLGSVSAACAAHAHCPVLIMHSSPATEVTGPALGLVEDQQEELQP